MFSVTGLCVGNSPLTGKFPAQRASNAENVSIWWPHHEVNIRSVNGLMPSGNKPITWTNIDPNLYRHMTSLEHNTFNRYAQLVVCYCRRWKWWCWGSRRHNEILMFGSWGRWWCWKLARLCKYRQDATQTGVYIIFNYSKFVVTWSGST